MSLVVVSPDFPLWFLSYLACMFMGLTFIPFLKEKDKWRGSHIMTIVDVNYN